MSRATESTESTESTGTAVAQFVSGRAEDKNHDSWIRLDRVESFEYDGQRKQLFVNLMTGRSHTYLGEQAQSVLQGLKAYVGDLAI
jgi:hypothetical protein